MRPRTVSVDYLICPEFQVLQELGRPPASCFVDKQLLTKKANNFQPFEISALIISSDPRAPPLSASILTSGDVLSINVFTPLERCDLLQPVNKLHSTPPLILRPSRLYRCCMHKLVFFAFWMSYKLVLALMEIPPVLMNWPLFPSFFAVWTKTLHLIVGSPF